MNTELERLMMGTFLSRVPALLETGMSFDEAIVEAKRLDDELCLKMLDSKSGYAGLEAYAIMRDELTKRIYHELRKQEVINAQKYTFRFTFFLKLRGLDPLGDYGSKYNIDYMLWIQGKWNEYRAIEGHTIDHDAFDRWLETHA